MRGELDGLVHPHPMGLSVPGLFQDDDFTRRFLDALDEVAAPLDWTLDNLDAYIDPGLTPADFLPWLATWVGLEVDHNWDASKQREQIGVAVENASWRGTVRGVVHAVADHVGISTDDVEVSDTGGVSWGIAPDTPLPGVAEAAMTVSVRVDDPEAVDSSRVSDLIDRIRPAHVARLVEVTSR